MEQVLIIIAMMCGPQTQSLIAQACQQKLTKCVLDKRCGVKKCNPEDATLASCIAGE